MHVDIFTCWDLHVASFLHVANMHVTDVNMHVSMSPYMFTCVNTCPWHACFHANMHVTDVNMQKMEQALSCNIHVGGSNMHSARSWLHVHMSTYMFTCVKICPWHACFHANMHVTFFANMHVGKKSHVDMKKISCQHASHHVNMNWLASHSWGVNWDRDKRSNNLGMKSENARTLWHSPTN